MLRSSSMVMLVFSNREALGIKCFFLFFLFLFPGNGGGEHCDSHRSAGRGAHQTRYRGDRRAGEGGGRLGHLQLDRRRRREGTA